MKLKSDLSEMEKLKLIIDKSDQARETLQLVEQLEPLLPITCFEDLTKIKSRTIRFRYGEFDIRMFEEMIPSIVFPIQSTKDLIERVAAMIGTLPKHLALNHKDPAFIRREMNRLAMPGVQANGLPPSQSFQSLGDSLVKAGRITSLGKPETITGKKEE